MTKVSYFTEKMPSKGHSAIYKIHKYFARRPHNQFRAVIEHYVPPGGLVLDCFAGGGVTLVEGLTSGRRVISLDVNPIASLIQQAQILEVSASRINAITSQISKNVYDLIGTWFSTICRSCHKTTPYRWIERAYVVNCPNCNSETLLDEDSKFVQASGKKKNGTYTCNYCKMSYESVSVKRTKSEILNIRYKCTTCSIEEAADSTSVDIDLSNEIIAQEKNFLERFNIPIPTDEIPLDWDRQSEDALSRKGFVTFADLFTVRNRIFTGLMLHELESMRDEITDKEFLGALTQISALIRYVNSMTFSTSTWMDGRPVAWAKHAFWTPNQFIEVNPFEYLSHRQLATTKWDADRVSRFSDKLGSSDPIDVVNGSADYSVICCDSREMPVPDESIDAVITDPPFGGNVQYGELTHLWQVWLRDLNPFEKDLFELQAEILVHRKKKENGKTAKDYENGLHSVFDECFRVLRENGILSFTFNNKSSDAWFAVMKAAFDAGFILENEGVHYHEEITAYRDTAHLRYDGELQGDVLYTFLKSSQLLQKIVIEDPINWLRDYLESADWTLGRKEQAINLHLEIIRKSAAQIADGRPYKDVIPWLDLLSVIGRSNKINESLLDTCKGIVVAN